MIQAALNLLLAQTTATPDAAAAPSAGAATTERVIYEISRLRAFDDERLPVALIVAGAIAIVSIVWQVYRRDTIELARGPRIAVMLLRFVAKGETAEPSRKGQRIRE